MKIDDIPGSVEVAGREEEIEVRGFRHEVFMPTDRMTGKATGTRVHLDFVIVKHFDKASPKLYQYLCNGKVIPVATLRWFRTNDDGAEEVYFTHELEKARVTAMHPHMPDVDNPSNAQYLHMEEVCFRYEKITWTETISNVTFTDSWIEGR